MEGNANDSKNSNNLTVTGSPATVAGKFGNALDFEYDSTQFAKGTLTAPTGAFTIGGWINLETFYGASGLCCFGNSAGTNLVGLAANDTDKVGFFVNGSAVITSDIAISLGSWTFIACVNDGTNKKVMVNDTIKSTADATAPSTTSVFGIACYGDYPSGNSDGIFDEVFYFDRALSDTELLNYYQGINAGFFLFFD
jgi:hypothetical protein